MCYDNNARPPFPPGPTGPAAGQDIVLAASDGNRFAAYAAQPDGPARALMLIYPDVRGLHPFYKDLALRFAQVGMRAAAMDYFGRTAGLTERGDDFVYRPHVDQMRLPSTWADTQAALDYLRSESHAGLPAFVLGFCLGGSLALTTATGDFGLAGAVAFYAGLGRKWDEKLGTTLEAARFVRTSVLGLFGGNDPGIPNDQVEALDMALDGTGVAHEIVIYPGAPHSFFDRKAVDYAEASADAWRRVLGFIEARA